MTDLSFIYKRHSVRTFKPQEIPNDDIISMLKAAEYAPSGRNLQNWHFVVVKNKKVLSGIMDVITQKNNDLNNKLASLNLGEDSPKPLSLQTFIKDAPALVFVYAGPYPVTGYELLKSTDASEEELDSITKPSPGIQNISAALENFMLAAATMGYGTCWMTGLNYAAKEISEYIGFKKEGYYMAAMTPLGVPASLDNLQPPRKPVEEIMTLIE